ncbi:fasciclin-1 isoform X5 [Temnothorax longispinosus]|uniref:fasciclin-1 isoform X5 n=1 Tax=Temnothorax longispinosus TaxID=300112 RepID=UPI003A993859
MLAFLFAAALAVARIHASQVTMDAKIRDDSDLSQFYQLLEASQVANTTLTYRHVTVFAPTNRAFQKYNGSTKNLVLYHMSNRPLTIEELRDSISSELEGNPPLWITRRPGKYSVNVYINNAMILLEQSNFQSKLKVNGDTMTQVLHIINEVLEPVRSNSAESPIYNPNAFQFLNQSENLNLGDHRVRTFRQRIVIEKKEAIFKAEGRFTFFIPVDEGFKPEPRPQKIDQLVIDGHVLPNEVLFTAPTPDKVPYPTLVFNDNLRVVVSFLKSQNKVYVQSDTLVGDTTHQAGVVLAEIVKANIPVRNGVVHLIQRPLMVVDSTVKDFLEVPTAADKKKLYFNVVQGPRENQTVTVEGGGVNATIITPNIAATNGIIHIIDRVLGVPYTTVLDKLRTDPMLNSTYLLGQRRGFNDQLNDTTKRFTYFAPLDYAWKEASNNYPSTTKKLFMPEYSYHTKQILERHLVIADQAFTMAKLREISNDTLFLPAARDILKLRVKEYGETEKHDENAIRPEVSGYTLEWEGKRIRVVRPDVECTNGIIHVISAVFLKDSDVRVTGGASLATLAPHLIMILIAKWHL